MTEPDAYRAQLETIFPFFLADRFFDCGSQAHLERKFGLDAPAVLRAVMGGPDSP